MKIMLARQMRAAVAAATAESEEAAKSAADAEISPAPAPLPPALAAAGSGEPEITPGEPLATEGGPAGDGAAAALGMEEKKRVKKFRWAQPERELMPEPEPQPFTWGVRCRAALAPARTALDEFAVLGCSAGMHPAVLGCAQAGLEAWC